MNCREYKKKVSLLVDGELGAAQEKSVQEHLSVCPDCRAFHERAAALGERMQSLGHPGPGPALAEAVKERIAAERTRRVGTDALTSWRLVPIMLVAVPAALWLGDLAGRSVSEVLVTNTRDEVVEYLLPDQSTSLAAVFADTGPEENGR